VDPRVKLIYWLYFTTQDRAMFKYWLEDDKVRSEYCRFTRQLPMPGPGRNHLGKMMKLIAEELVNGCD